MDFVYEITTEFDDKPAYWKPRRKVVYGTLNRAVAIYRANYKTATVTTRRASVGSFDSFDIATHYSGEKC